MTLGIISKEYTRRWFGDVKPDLDTPAQARTGTDYATVRKIGGENFLELDSSTQCEYLMADADGLPANATGWTIVFQAYVVGGTLRFTVDDGVKRQLVTISPTLISVSASTYAADFTRPRTVHLSGKTTALNVYLDDGTTAVIAGTNAGTSSTQGILWGINGASSHAYVRYLVVANTGQYTPSECPGLDLATSYAAIQDVRSATGIASDIVPDDEIAQFIREAEQIVDLDFTDWEEYAGRMFVASGTATQELIDWDGRGNHIRTHFYPIIAITTLQRQDSAGVWTTLTAGLDSDYHASADEMELGRIRVYAPPTYHQDSYRCTYTYGCGTTPDMVRHLVVAMAKLQVYEAAIEAGTADPFAARETAAQREIEHLRERLKRMAREV